MGSSTTTDGRTVGPSPRSGRRRTSWASGRTPPASGMVTRTTRGSRPRKTRGTTASRPPWPRPSRTGTGRTLSSSTPSSTSRRSTAAARTSSSSRGDAFDAPKFGGDTPYGVMFGPDICGSSNKRTHVILHYDKKDDNLLIKKNVNTEDNQLTHLYTFVLRPDNTFEVFIDNKSVRAGKLDDEFDFLPDKEIKDPDQSKPEDWVDEKNIPDPDDKKPEGYDDIPRSSPT